jgi:hypothetical protein
MFDWYAAVHRSELGIIPYQFSVPAEQDMREALEGKLVIASRMQLKRSELAAIQEGIGTFFQMTERDQYFSLIEEKVAESRLNAQKYESLDLEKNAEC